MDVDAMRALGASVASAVIGVPMTVTRPAPDDDPIVTSGIWLALPPDETRPFGSDFQRRDPRKVLVLPRGTTLPTLPRGTTVSGSELQGGPVTTWRVDGFERPVEVDEWRVVVVPVVEP